MTMTGDSSEAAHSCTPRPTYEELVARVAQLEAARRQQLLDSERLLALVERSEEALRQSEERAALARVAAEARADSEERLRLAQAYAHVGVWDWDICTGAIQWTAELERVCGYAPGTFPGSYQAFIERVHPDDIARVERTREAALRAHEPFDYDFRLVLPSGRTTWLNCKGGAIYDDAGSPRRVFGVDIDITERKQIEEALRESEARLGIATKAAQLGIYDFDLRTGTIQWDSRMRELWAVGPETPITYDVFMSGVHPDDRIYTQAVLDAALDPAGTGEYSAEHRVIGLGDGVERWIAATGRAFFEQDQPVRLIGNVQDVTGRKRTEEALRESERRYRAIGESIDYGVWVCDPDGRNTYVSPSFLKLVGLTQEQCSDFGWGDVLHPDDAERTIAAWKECVRTGGIWDMEHRFRGVDGAWHPLLARGVPVKNERGELVCWAGINLDIGRLKQTEAELREREAALAESNRQKNHFLAVLSHELRNPLAPIINSLFVLDHAPPGGEQSNRARAVIQRQVAHMTRLVDDLLDVTRIVSGKLRVRRVRFDLAQMLVRVGEDHRVVFLDEGIDLEVRLRPGPLWMDGDEVRMAQAVGNLLGNAAKFTERAGRVALGLELDSATKMAVIRVRDTGLGVHPDLLPRIFEPFMQADETLDRAKGGLGLGLALVKSVIELHGGTVAARSAGPGAGTEFVVRLPVEVRADSPFGEGELPSSGPPPRRILIIEDNQDSADSLRDLLTLDQHQVEVSYSGPEGLRVAKGFGPEVVLCDIGLPGMSGYEVAKALRADEALRSAYLVALTGYALPDDQQRATAAGFDRHVAKPPSPGELAELLARLPGLDRT
jgi:PAS domain S-box-containing protein